MRRLAILAALILPVQGNASSPIAEVLCAPSQDMELKLKGNFRASLRASGLRGPDQVVQVWADRRGEWTMVMVYASGQSCIVAMGEDWEAQLSTQEDTIDPS